MKSFLNLYKPLIAVLIFCIAAMYVLGGRFSGVIYMYIGAGLIIFACIISLLIATVMNRKIKKFAINIKAVMSEEQANLLVNFPVPVIITLDNGDMLWQNTICRENVLKGEEVYGRRCV